MFIISNDDCIFFRNVGVEPKTVQDQNNNIRLIARTFSTLSFKDNAESISMKSQKNTPKFRVTKPNRKLEYRFRRAYQNSKKKLKEQTKEAEKWKNKFFALKAKCVGHCKEIMSLNKKTSTLSQKLEYNESIVNILKEYQQNLNRYEKFKLAKFFSTKSENQEKRKIIGCHQFVSSYLKKKPCVRNQSQTCLVIKEYNL